MSHVLEIVVKVKYFHQNWRNQALFDCINLPDCESKIQRTRRLLVIISTIVGWGNGFLAARVGSDPHLFFAQDVIHECDVRDRQFQRFDAGQAFLISEGWNFSPQLVKGFV